MGSSTFNFDPKAWTNSINSILNDTIAIEFNDNNLKPSWVEHPALYTEFHVKRNKETLIIVVGESWTYGETIKGIATGIQKYSFETQLQYTIGPRLAVMLDADLYQYAVPGNCNFYMFSELERILKHTSTLGYKKIYVCAQMTEPSREQSLIVKLNETAHPLTQLIRPTEKITFDNWLATYDDIFFDQYENMISQYTNLECILWKNFCRVNTKNTTRKFKIVDKTWIQYSANILGKELAAPSFYSVGWLDSIMKDFHYSSVIFDKLRILDEMSTIETSNNFIKATALQSHHPNEFGHLLWAQYLARKAGWKNDI